MSLRRVADYRPALFFLYLILTARLLGIWGEVYGNIFFYQSITKARNSLMLLGNHGPRRSLHF